jgi:hypothetical protein
MRHQRVYARLRRAISAFTRVFDALRRNAGKSAEAAKAPFVGKTTQPYEELRIDQIAA